MKKALLFFGLVFILTGCGLFLWTAIPAPETVRTLTIGGEQEITDQAPGLWWEIRTVTLEYPSRLRLGEVARLRLEAAPAGSVPGAEIPFERYAVFAEAYPDMGGVSIAPQGTLSLAWQPDQPLEFTWQVRGDNEGEFEGRLWFSLRLIERSNSQEIHYPLLALALEIQVEALFGLDITALRWIAGILVLVGLGGLAWLGWRSRKAQVILSS